MVGNNGAVRIYEAFTNHCVDCTKLCELSSDSATPPEMSEEELKYEYTQFKQLAGKFQDLLEALQ